MKYLIFVLIPAFLTSCGSAQKLVERTTADNGRAIVTKELFSGIDYLYVEKKLKSKIQYKLIYDCECGIDNKISLRKDDLSDSRQTTVWTAVTDTVGKPIFFGDVIAASRLYSPFNYMPITQEEVSLLEEGLSKADKACCRNLDKPVSKIIGYVRVKLN
jgi:hypothetical protein